MRKVGIVTIFDLNNYGNRLQNYAVELRCGSYNASATML